MPTAQFYALTYCELRLILEGYRARRRREVRERREESAWRVSWLLLPHKSPDAEPITADQLMGRKSRVSSVQSKEGTARAFVEAFRAQSEQKRLSDGK